MNHLIDTFEQTRISESTTGSTEYPRRPPGLSNRAQSICCGEIWIWMEWFMGNELTEWRTRFHIVGLSGGSPPFYEINEALGPGDTYNGLNITESYMLERMKEIRHCLVETFLAHSPLDLQIHMATCFLRTFWFGDGWFYLWTLAMEDVLPYSMLPIGYKRIVPSDHLGVIAGGTGSFMGDEIRRWPLEKDRAFGLALQHDYLAPVSSMSGWAYRPRLDPYFSISGDLYTRKVKVFCQALDFHLLERPDLDQGEPGRYQACHAEMQLWTCILAQYYELGIDGHLKELDPLLRDFQVREVKMLVTQMPCPECDRFMRYVCNAFEFRLDVIFPDRGKFQTWRYGSNQPSCPLPPCRCFVSPTEIHNRFSSPYLFCLCLRRQPLIRSPPPPKPLIANQ